MAIGGWKAVGEMIEAIGEMMKNGIGGGDWRDGGDDKGDNER